MASFDSNHQLQKFIFESLDNMLIQYNKGLIIQMSLEQKLKLKQIIVQIQNGSAEYE